MNLQEIIKAFLLLKSVNLYVFLVSLLIVLLKYLPSIIKDWLSVWDALLESRAKTKKYNADNKKNS